MNSFLQEIPTMTLISGFQIEEVLFENDRTSIYRAKPENSDVSVILKTKNSIAANSEQLYRLKREFEFLTLLESQFTAKALKFTHTADQTLLILEDTNGHTLSPELIHKTYSTKEKLELLINITEALNHIHGRKIIHKDINPSNILIEDNGRIRIIDFEFSEYFSNSKSNVEKEAAIESALEYTSPEQTGRMNNTIDYRTDFYSLGITFYHLLTGVLPFQSKDPLELIHCHIAKLPLFPSDVDENIPLVLSELIVKLIQKNSSDRYQGTKGILFDLKQCLELITPSGDILDFTLATKDISENFIIPTDLYGRETEISVLESLYAKSKDGNKQIAMVCGYSGIGKTSLINSLRNSILAVDGFFGTGHFSQFEREIPYSALIEALKGIVRQLLTLPSDQIPQWKAKLNSTLQPNGKLITDVIPELELIIGEQLPVKIADPTFSYHRFKQTMQDFVGALATKEHPLTLHIDNLQWADSATLSLLDHLASTSEQNYCFVIGSYREHQVESNDTLVETLRSLQRNGSSLTTIELAPLKATDIAKLLSDTLSRPCDEIDELTSLLEAKSQGNPLFIHQLIEQFYEEGFIYFDHHAEQWDWKTQKISEFNLDGDVTYILKKKIARLPTKTLEKLKIAACLGSRFTIDTLSISSDSQRDDLELQLQMQTAVNDGLLIKGRSSTNELNPLVTNSFAIPNNETYYIFSHERVRQTIYNLFERKDRPVLHNQ